jgi:hypothetical protein
MSTDAELLQFFKFSHLPAGRMQEASKRFHYAAHRFMGGDKTVLGELLEFIEHGGLPANSEAMWALQLLQAVMKDVDGDFYSPIRLLLMSKDCAVRSIIMV